MLYTMTIIMWMGGHMAFAQHDFGLMKTCLAAKNDYAVLLKKYDPIISCEPKLGGI